MRRSVVVASLAAAAVGAFLLVGPRLWDGQREPATVDRAAAPPTRTPDPPQAPAPATSPTPDSALPAVDPDRRALAQPGGPGAPGGMADTISYPRAPKLTERPLSTIPHEVVGAWDDDPDSTQLGTRRAFILVVDPGLSDRELADLARDVRDSHLDADWLTLRIFDSAAAATRPSWTDGGETRESHLVAELRRNTAGPGESLKVRGQEVDL